eukprot:1501196-Alexandrium_andersonii.AAC.1
MRSPATGTVAMAPAAMMAKPSLLEACVRVQRSPRPSSGQQGAACAASAWRTPGGAKLHGQAAQ